MTPRHTTTGTISAISPTPLKSKALSGVAKIPESTSKRHSVRDPGYGKNNATKKPVLWLTSPKVLLDTVTPWIACGNEASLTFIYGRLVLTAEVPAYDRRKAVLDGTLDVADAETSEVDASGSDEDSEMASEDD